LKPDLAVQAWKQKTFIALARDDRHLGAPLFDPNAAELHPPITAQRPRELLHEAFGNSRALKHFLSGQRTIRVETASATVETGETIAELEYAAAYFFEHCHASRRVELPEAPSRFFQM